MLATVPNMGTRNTDMGKNRVLLSRMSILSGKTHTNQAQQSSVVSVLWSWASARRDGETTGSAVAVGGPGRPERSRLPRLNLADSWPSQSSLPIAGQSLRHCYLWAGQHMRDPAEEWRRLTVAVTAKTFLSAYKSLLHLRQHFGCHDYGDNVYAINYKRNC